MEHQEREAAIDAEHGDELDLHLGLRSAPIRRNLQLPNPKIPAVAVREDSSDLSLNMPIWGKRGTISEERRESENDSSKRRRKGGNSNCNDNEDGNQLNLLPYLMKPALVGGGGGFRRYQLAEKNSGHGGAGDSLKRSISSCSRGSSGVASDYQSTSGQSGSSSEGGSQSSHSQPTALHTFGSAPPNSINGKAECNSSSYQTEPNQAMKKVPTHRIRSPKGVDPGRPPKPQAHLGNEVALLPHMPCVATTGNGPNGKRITGFLYKYNKSEVSIVCVCHGTSFSPAGFVEHAGGVGIENPLKHITVAPSTLS